MRKHIAKSCGVEHCPNEADKWIALGGGTLRLCAGHLEALSPETDIIRVCAPENEPHPFNEFEIGEYACSPDCHVCNN